MAGKSPLNIVKARFGDKSKLVEAVKAFTTDELWLARTCSRTTLCQVDRHSEPH